MRTYSKEEPLLMIPGPVEGHQDVLQNMSQRILSHTEHTFVESFQGALENLISVFQASPAYNPLVIAGGGTLAMEVAMLNLIDQSKQQKALICSTGYFGKRYTAIADSLGIKYDVLESSIGSKVDTDALEQKLSSGEYDFAFTQHVDTSTGVASDIESFGKICTKADVLSIVDGVCAIGAEEFRQETWNIDIAFTGAQKALTLPPGLAILMYSPRARAVTESQEKKIPSYYADVDNWWPIMDAYRNGGVKYFSTPATNLIAALFYATEKMVAEGMEQIFSRHKRLSTKFRSEMENMGFEFVTNKDARAVTLSTPKYLDMEKGPEFRAKMLEEGVQIAGGIQPGIANTYFRVGHMGTIQDEHIDYTLNAIANSIK